MGHQESEVNVSPAEKKFRQLMLNGDDFFKIEIWRSALKNYREAASLDINREVAEQKIDECLRLMKQERKVIYILLSVAVVIVALVIIF